MKEQNNMKTPQYNWTGKIGFSRKKLKQALKEMQKNEYLIIEMNGTDGIIEVTDIRQRKQTESIAGYFQTEN